MVDEPSDENLIGLVTVLIDGLIKDSYELMGLKVNPYAELEEQKMVLEGAYHLARDIHPVSTRNEVLLELGRMITRVKENIRRSVERTEPETKPNEPGEPLLRLYQEDEDSPPVQSDVESSE